jgi:3-oxoacyl-[acyl-carrier protein] reductase
MTNINNKTALVTGASRGIGRATALALANAGARVLIHYGRRESEAKVLREQIQASGGQADTLSGKRSCPGSD